MLEEKDQKTLAQLLPFWRSLTPEQQAMLEKSASARTYAKGESLHRGSEDCSGLMLLIEGQLRAYALGESGREITLYRLFPRDLCVFTASCVLKNIQFDVFIEAQKESRVFLVPAHLFQELMHTSLAVSDYASQLIAARFSEVMWVMEQVLFMRFDQRLALFLLQAADIEGTDTLHLTHEDIAKELGSAREVVTRMLKYFQSDGSVSLFRGGLRILSRERLKAAAHPDTRS